MTDFHKKILYNHLPKCLARINRNEYNGNFGFVTYHNVTITKLQYNTVQYIVQYTWRDIVQYSTEHCTIQYRTLYSIPGVPSYSTVQYTRYLAQ